MNLRFVCYDLYDIVYGKVVKDLNYETLRTDKNNEVLVNFLIEVLKTRSLLDVDVNWIYQYLIYQFDYWIDKKTKFNLPGSFNQVFAMKSYDRYQNVSEKYSWYNAEKHLSNYVINRGILTRFQDKESINYSDTHISEEGSKEKFLNTYRGLLFCIDNTTLYNNQSSICNKCIFSNKCKRILKENYKSIYYNRGYV